MRQSLEKKLVLLEQESQENKKKLREQKYAVRYVIPPTGVSLDTIPCMLGY